MTLNILFSASIGESRQQTFIEQYPQHSFTFGKKVHEVEEHLPDADIIVTYGEDLTADHIKKATKLQWIMVLSTGVDRLPFEELMKRNIIVTNCRGVHGIPMSEYAISMLLQVSRQEAVLLRHAEESKWDRSVKMREITGSTMTVLGVGTIGQEVARLAKAFNMTTYGVATSERKVDHFDEVVTIEKMNDVFENSDFVVAVLPSTPSTKGLLTADHFKAMKNDAVFLNMGRGDLVASEVIIQALESGQIAHAVLDVVEEEPLPEDHPLWKTEGVTITPHLSGISPHYNTRALKIFTDNLAQFERGENEFQNVVDPSRRY